MAELDDQSISTAANTSVKVVIDEYAALAKRALALLQELTNNPAKGYLYSDGSYGLDGGRADIVSVTWINVLEYAIRDDKTPPKKIEGLTFEELVAFLPALSTYINEQKDIGFTTPLEIPEWSETYKKIRFGADKEEPTSFQLVMGAVDAATKLLNFIINLSKSAVVRSGEAVTAEKPQEAVAQSTGGTGNGVGIPTGVGFGLKDVESKLTDEEKEKKRKEEKPEDEEEKKKKDDKPRNFIQEIASGDAAFHKEVVRMEVMLANQLAAFYGIDEKGLPAFTQEFTQYIAPHLYFELQKLSAAELKETLKSSKGRSNIYLSALLRMQHDPTFMARLTVYLKTPTAQKNKKVKPPTDEEIKQTKQAEAKQVATAIVQLEGNKQYISPEDIEHIGDVRATTTSTLAEELRNILGANGARLPESEISKILVGLQAFAITRANIHHLTPDKYQEIFGAILGSQNAFTFSRIQHYFQEANLDWTRLFSAYVESTRLDIFEKTQNPAILFMDENGQPTKQVINKTYERLWTYGSATATSLYTPQKVLLQRKSELEATGPAGVNTPEYLEISDALGLKQQNLEALKRFATLTPLSQQHVFASLGFTSAAYQELHLTEIYEFLHTFETTEEGVETVQTTGTLEYLDYIHPQSFLTADTSSGEYRPAGADSPWQQYSPQQGNGNRKIGNFDVDRALGKAALALITSGASAPIVENVEKFQSFIARMPGGEQLNHFIDEYGWKMVDRIGKAVAWILGLSLVQFILGLLGLIAAALAIIKAVASFVSFLQGIGAGITTGVKYLAGQVGSGIMRLATGVGKALSGFTASGIGFLKALSATPFMSGAAIAGTTVIMGYTVFFSNSVNPAFLTNVGNGTNSSSSNYADGVGNRGCWPTSGHVNGLDKYSPRLCTPSIFNNYCAHGTTGQCYKGLGGEDVCGVGAGRKGEAIDIGASVGSAVYAPYPGKATFYGQTSGICYSLLGIKYCGYGNHVVLKSTLEGKDVVFIFGHLKDFNNFKEGETDVDVNIGTVLGTVDNTGNSTGDHLHYEVLGTTRDSIIPEHVAYDQSLVSTCDPDLQGAQL